MTYKQTIKKLNDNHFYPKTLIEVGAKSKKTIGLEIYSPPILLEERMKKLKEILPNANISKGREEGQIIINI